MPYTVSFVSLGCAKNQVNCEQMIEQVQAAGYTVQAAPEGADVVVVNTCGFLASACEEAIDNILEMAALKRSGQVKKILVTGCMAQRYKKDAGIGTIIALMIPYTVVVLVVWLILFVVWFMLGIPLGPGYPVRL